MNKTTTTKNRCCPYSTEWGIMV